MLQYGEGFSCVVMHIKYVLQCRFIVITGTVVAQCWIVGSPGGVIHTKIHLISPDCPMTSIAFQCKIGTFARHSFFIVTRQSPIRYIYHRDNSYNISYMCITYKIKIIST